MIMMFTTTNLMILWVVTGAICFLPFIVQKTWLRYAVVPFILFSVFVSFQVNEQFIGRAKYEMPKDEFIFKSYSVTKVNGKKYITMWIIDNTDDKLIRFEWSEEKQKSLKKAQKRAEAGIPQIGKLKKKEGKNNQRLETSDQIFVFYDFPAQKIFPKNAK